MVDLRIEEYNVGDIGTNCYFIVNADTKEMLVIDPGGDGKDLIRRINNSELKPVAVLLTHGHYDHAADADVVAKEYDIPIYAHEAERETLENPNLNLSPMFGRREIYHADKYVKDGDILNLAGFTIRVIHTPGHTVGGCCYYFDGNKVLASGDTLFCGSIGRTDFPKGSMSDLVRSIKEKLLDLPGDTAVLPGHESRTTIGYERQYNAFL
ncbi:MAG: MBL fold metallo-hydrolase [Eubacterium sp.]